MFFIIVAIILAIGILAGALIARKRLSNFLRHPIAYTHGVIIAWRVGLHLNGVWAGGLIDFYDPVTGSNLTAKNIRQARFKLFALWAKSESIDKKNFN